MKDKLVWFSSRYEFVNEPEIFYFHYMQPEDPLEEEGQCLEAIYDEKINKFQAYHTDCGDKRRYVCVKACKKNIVETKSHCNQIVTHDCMFFVHGHLQIYLGLVFVKVCITRDWSVATTF